MPVVGERKGTTITVLISLFLLGSMSGIVFASSGNWVEVASFSQGRPWFGDTNSFRCDHVEWRIRWAYEKVSAMLTAFLFDVKLQDTGEIIGNYSNSGKLDITEGIYNITDYEGEFYLFIGTNAKSYSIIVEQNLESIPEFPSWIILPLFLAATAFALAVRKKRTS